MLPVIMSHQDNTILTNHHWSFIHRDIPNLQSTPVTHKANQIVLVLGQLVSKQQQAWAESDLRRQQEAAKLPSDLFGFKVITLMR
jgi:hypothetical protein